MVDYNWEMQEASGGLNDSQENYDVDNVIGTPDYQKDATGTNRVYAIDFPDRSPSSQDTYFEGTGNFPVPASITFAGWHKANAVSGNQPILGGCSGAFGDRGFMCIMDSDSTHYHVKFYVSSNGNNFQEKQADDIELVTDTWYHITCVWDSVTDTMKIYVDGTERTLITVGDTGPTGALHQPALPLRIGAVHQAGGVNDLKANGQTCGVYILDRVATQEEINQMMDGTLLLPSNIGVPHDLSAQNIYIIIRNAAQQVWNGTSFERYQSSDYHLYPIDAKEQGLASQFYGVILPTSLPTGDYSIAFYEQSGSAPGEGDTLIDYVDNFPWNSSIPSEVGLSDLDTRLPASLVGGKMDSDMVAISGDTASADALERALEGTNLGSVDTATFTATTTVFETDLTEASDDHFNNQALVWGTGAANAGLTFFITDSEGTTTNVNNKVKLTTETMPNIPADTDTFIIVGGK